MAQASDGIGAARAREPEVGSSRAWAAPKLTRLGALDSHTRQQTQFSSDTSAVGSIAGSSGTVS